MLKLNFEIAGEAQFLRGFSRFGDSIQDLSPVFKEMAEDFRAIEGSQFSTEGSTGSGGWAPLSPQYAAWKAARFPGRPILTRGNFLRGSLAGKTGDTIEQIGPKELVLGTQIRYAIFHQKGTRRMPARPVIQLSDADKARWGKRIHRYLVKEAKLRGLI